MKNWFAANRRLLGLLAVLLPLAGLLVFVALRAGPLAAVPVTVATVESQALAPALFGIGTVEARYTHRIGPTFAGRVATVAVQPGDAVRAGQEVGEMDPIDLDERLVAQEAGLRRAEANLLAAQAQMREVGARRSFADVQATRYARLLQSNSVSGEAAAAKRQEADGAAAAHQAATASAEAAKQELSRLRAERDALRAQRANLRLVAPVDGLVVRRDADPGTTVVAGQAVVEIVEPASVWIHARFDQQRATGLATDCARSTSCRWRCRRHDRLKWSFLVLRVGGGGGATIDGVERAEQLGDAVGGEAVENHLAIAARGDKLEGAEPRQMLGEGRLGEANTRRQLADAELVAEQIAQDQQPLGVGHGGQQFGSAVGMRRIVARWGVGGHADQLAQKRDLFVEMLFDPGVELLVGVHAVSVASWFNK